MFVVRLVVAVAVLVSVSVLLLGVGALAALPTAYVCWVAWALYFVGPAWWRWHDGRRGGDSGEPRRDSGLAAASDSVAALRPAGGAGGAGGAAGPGWGFEGLDDA